MKLPPTLRRLAALAAVLGSAPCLQAEVLVNLDATNLPEGELDTWTNTGTLTGDFFAENAAASVERVGRVLGVTLDGSSIWYVGPDSPDSITGDNSRSIEAWIFNPSVSIEETVVAWGMRGGPEGTNMSFNHGTHDSYGAVGHWGGDPDVGWDDQEEAGTWTIDRKFLFGLAATGTSLGGSKIGREGMRMRGGRYPRMPFNQQMSIPVELRLRRFAEGIRLCTEPVKEIESLRGKHHAWCGTIPPDANPLDAIRGELFDICLDIEPRGAAEVGLNVRGEPIVYNIKEKTLSCQGASALVELANGRLVLRVLVDCSSIEIFAADGRVNMAHCFLPPAGNRTLSLLSRGGEANVQAMDVWQLKSTYSK